MNNLYVFLFVVAVFLIFSSVSCKENLRREIMGSNDYLAGVGLSLGLNLAVLAGVIKA